ncbi:MAG: hypothetical protein HY675_23015 [Chloroflexi bacterium]|nr:hypothetical protein [Chloroflexota bacterium]
MDEERIKKVRAEIYRRYPELRGVEPIVEFGPPHVAGGQTRAPMQIFSFRKVVEAADGKQLVRIIRATVDDEGNLVKVVEAK